jgi:hypothetical protein
MEKAGGGGGGGGIQGNQYINNPPPLSTSLYALGQGEGKNFFMKVMIGNYKI